MEDAKNKIKDSINNNSDLTDSEKDSLIKEVEDSKTIEEVNSIEDKANKQGETNKAEKEAKELEDAKNKVKDSINNNSDLTDSEKDSLTKEVEDSKSIEEVNSIDEKAKKQGESNKAEKEAKELEDAKNKVKDSINNNENLTETEKDSLLKEVEDSKTIEEVNSVDEKAKKQGETNKAEKEAKELEDAKNKVKDSINNNENLTETEKDSLIKEVEDSTSQDDLKVIEEKIQDIENDRETPEPPVDPVEPTDPEEKNPENPEPPVDPVEPTDPEEKNPENPEPPVDPVEPTDPENKNPDSDDKNDENNPSKVNKEQLKEFYNKVTNLVSTEYTPESWQAFKENREAALKVINDVNATQEQVDTALKNLTESHAGLNKIVPVNKNELRDFYNKVTNLDSTNYQPESWEKFKASREAALQIINDTNATQVQVDHTLKELQAAHKGLQARDVQVKVNKNALRSYYNQVTTLRSTDYTPESWNAFKSAREAALRVINDANATQEEVDRSLKELQTTHNQLQEKTKKVPTETLPEKEKNQGSVDSLEKPSEEPKSKIESKYQKPIIDEPTSSSEKIETNTTASAKPESTTDLNQQSKPSTPLSAVQPKTAGTLPATGERNSSWWTILGSALLAMTGWWTMSKKQKK